MPVLPKTTRLLAAPGLFGLLGLFALSGCSMEMLFSTDLRGKPHAVIVEGGADSGTTEETAAEEENPDGDNDQDGMTNGWEKKLGFDPNSADSASSTYGANLGGNGVGDCDEDVDGDGIPTCWEINHGLDPEDDADLLADDDQDGYSNAEEATEHDPQDAADHPGASPAFDVFDDGMTVQGRTNSTTVYATMASCQTDDQVLFSASAVKPAANDAGFTACTTTAHALTTTLASTTEGSQTVYVWRKNAHGVVEHPLSATVIYDVTGPTGALTITSLSSLTLNLGVTPPTAADKASAVLRRYAELDCSARTAVEGTAVTVALTDTAVADSGLALATPYCYKMFWYDTLGNEASARTSPGYDGVGPAGGIEVTGVSASTVTMSHAAPADADYAAVTLRRNAGSSCAATTATDGVGVTMAANATSVTDGSLAAATPYCYKVFWYDAFGNFTAAVPDGVPTPSITLGTNTCNLTGGHSVYYFDSTIELEFTCSTAVSSITPTGKPSFLTANVSGSTVTFTGTAPSTTSTTNWSFAVAGVTTQGDATAITTQVISTSGLDATLALGAGNFDPTDAAHNYTERSLGHTVPLSGSWDGNMADVSLVATAIDTDMHGDVTYASSCTSPSPPYVCNGASASNTSNTKNGDLRLRWRWSGFDQGKYYLDADSEVTIEGSVVDLGTDSMTFTVPLQATGGNVTISGQADTADSVFDDERYQFDVAVARGSASTPTAPALGLLYFRKDTNDKPTYQRIAVDRTDDPSGGASGVTQTWTALDLSNDNSQDFHIKSLTDNTWAAVGAFSNADGMMDLRFSRVDDGSGAPAASAAEALTDHEDDFTIPAVGAAITAPFDDEGTTRIGIAYVKMAIADGDSSLRVAKVNPTATPTVSEDPDARYRADATAFEWADAGPQSIDNVRIGQIDEGGDGYFYVAFRENANLRLVKLRSAGASYAAQYANVTTTGFENADSSSSNQSVDLALGVAGGSTVAGVVYRGKTADPACYFARVDQNLTVHTPVKISTNGVTCYNPTIHFNPASGRFVVTFAELDGTAWDIYTSEIELTSADGAVFSGSKVVVVNNVGTAANYPLKLVTDFYPDGNWMAMFYRIRSGGTLVFHGYHVPGR